MAVSIPGLEIPPAFIFDEYGNLELAKEEARLDKYALQLRQNPKFKAYIIAYGSCGREGKDRAARAKAYLVKKRAIATGKIVTVDGGCKTASSVQLWLVPSGAKPPAPNGLQVISRCPVCRTEPPPAPAPQNRLVHIKLLCLSNVTQSGSFENGTRGGLARVATLRKTIAKESPFTLMLFGGGTLAPSVESTTYKGQQMVDAWNAAGLDVAVPGDHDFDFGPDVLRQRINESRFVWLGSNVVEKDSRKPLAGTSPFVIREFDGVKIGLLGLTSPDAKLRSSPGPNVDIEDPCQAAQQLVPRMQAAGAQFIVALAHLPMDQNKELLQCAPQINLVIGGAEQVALESLVGGRLILVPEKETGSPGLIDLYLTPDVKDGRPILQWSTIALTDQNTQPDPAVAEVIAKYAKGRDLDAKVGETSVALDALSAHNRTGETNLGNFIADAFRAATGADVALINGGAIRSDTLLPPGTLTRRNLLDILPFGSEIVKLEVSGAVLRQALENGVSRSAEDREPGRFPQVSGLRFTFDALRPPGARLIRLTVNDKPLDDKAAYTLATNNYLFIGGDGYGMFKVARRLDSKKMTESDVLQAAVSSVQTIAPRVDGRIVRLDRPTGIR